MKLSGKVQKAFSLNTYFTANNDLASITIKDILGEIIVAAICICVFKFFLMKMAWAVFYIGAALFERM